MWTRFGEILRESINYFLDDSPRDAGRVRDVLGTQSRRVLRKPLGIG